MQAVFEEIFEGKNINVKAEDNESSAKDRLHNFLLQGWAISTTHEGGR